MELLLITCRVIRTICPILSVGWRQYWRDLETRLSVSIWWRKLGSPTFQALITLNLIVTRDSSRPPHPSPSCSSLTSFSCTICKRPAIPLLELPSPASLLECSPPLSKTGSGGFSVISIFKWFLRIVSASYRTYPMLLLPTSITLRVSIISYPVSAWSPQQTYSVFGKPSWE